MKLALLLVALTAWAQESKVVRLRYADAGNVSMLLSKHGGYTVAGNTMVLSGSPEKIALLEALIKEIDVPPPEKRSIEITTYMILGSAEAAAAQPPSELSGVIKQLREIFPFPSYKLLETMFIRAAEDQGGETSGLMPGPGTAGDAMPKAIYQCRFNSVKVEDAQGRRRISLRGLRFGTKIPYTTGKDGYNYADLGANIDTVTVREGQKAVIGKAGVGPGKESLFLVLTARVAE